MHSENLERILQRFGNSNIQHKLSFFTLFRDKSENHLNAFGEQDMYMRVLTNFCSYAKPYIRNFTIVSNTQSIPRSIVFTCLQN